MTQNQRVLSKLPTYSLFQSLKCLPVDKMIEYLTKPYRSCSSYSLPVSRIVAYLFTPTRVPVSYIPRSQR